MDFFRRFTFLVCAPAFEADDHEGLRLQQIIAEVERLGFHVVKARRAEDAELAIQTDAAIGCMIVDWGKRGLEGKTAALMALAAGSTIAGNLSILGAASNVIIIQNAEKEGETLTFPGFVKIGLPLTLLQVLVYWLFLGPG